MTLLAVPAAVQGRGEGFGDVDPGSVHAPAIDALAERALFEGTLCGDSFCAGDPLLRWTMAVWMVRAVDGAEPAGTGSSRFADVDAGLWWAAHVERLAELGITVGCDADPLRFCPQETVTRGQMASFLVRAFGFGQPETSGGFADTTGSVHEGVIDALAAAGVTAGCGGSPPGFCPRADVSRAQMATFLARALGFVPLPEPPPPATQEETSESGFKSVSAGSAHTCAITLDGAVVCWGYNGLGETDAPPDVFTAVSAGTRHSCAITVDGVVCWGYNGLGEADAPEGFYKSVSVGSGHGCGIAADDTIHCWGFNYYGKVNAPGGFYKSVSVGSGHGCGIAADDTIQCWSHNLDGQADAPEGF